MTLRLPEEMHDKLEKHAKDNYTSKTAVIVALLKRKFEDKDGV